MMALSVCSCMLWLRYVSVLFCMACVVDSGFCGFDLCSVHAVLYINFCLLSAVFPP